METSGGSLCHCNRRRGERAEREGKYWSVLVPLHAVESLVINNKLCSAQKASKTLSRVLFGSFEIV